MTASQPLPPIGGGVEAQWEKQMHCLACGRQSITRQGRVATCRSCEVCYFIPARDLVRMVRR